MAIDEESGLCAMAEVRYFDDQMRYDLDQIDDVRYMTIMIHACHSGGFIEDLNNNPPHLSNRILISSCGETESSTIYGPLFCEWLNERTANYTSTLNPPRPNKKITHGDRNIGNDNTDFLKSIIKIEDIMSFGNHNNSIISINEMYINSVHSSHLERWYDSISPIYYSPELLIGLSVPEQIYL